MRHFRYFITIVAAFLCATNGMARADALPGKAGIITEWTQQQKGTTANGATTAETYAYSYDKAGRLTSSVRYVGTSTSSVNTLTEKNITYDQSGNLLTLDLYGASSGTTPTESLSFTYSGPKRTGWSYDSHGNVTSDPVGSSSIAWNVLDMPRNISSGTAGVQRSYLADGTLVQVSDGSSNRLYLGDMVFNQTSGTLSLESAGWDGGRLLPGSGTDKVLYYVTDHLGSVRVVKDGSGNIRQRYDYYPYGSVTRSWTSSSTTDNSEKRFRFGGKEITGTALGTLSSGADKYLDFGARLYSSGTAMWLSQDPMAESYYLFTPYLYCAGNPGNVVDENGQDITLYGADGSSVVIFMAGKDREWDLSSYGVNFQGNLYFDGLESAITFFDAAGIFDPTFISDGISALLNIYQGNVGNALFSAAAAVFPYVGDLPKLRHSDDLWEVYKIATHSHHIIPKALFAKMDDLNYVLRRDSELNRLIVPAGFHGNHPAYTKWVNKKLNEILETGNLTPEAVNGVIEMATKEINNAYIYYSKTGENMNKYFKLLE